MSERRLILTMAVGAYSERLAAFSLPTFYRYARRVGAHVRIVEEPYPHDEINDRFTRLQLGKLDAMREFLAHYDRVLWLDIDTLVRPDSPDIFALVPATHYAAVDECSLAWNCPTLGESHVHHVHRHMKEVCEQDGLPIPDTRGRYFNCGVQLASKTHAFLYQPAIHPR